MKKQKVLLTFEESYPENSNACDLLLVDCIE
jgi:hypothetical protein